MTAYEQINIREKENWTFLYVFYFFALLALGLSLRQFDLAWVYKIAIFYTGLMTVSLALLSAPSRRKLSLGWQKAQKGALKLMALL